MKKIICLTTAFLMLSSSFVLCATTRDDEKSEIDLTISNPLPGKGEVERSIDAPYINAFLYNNTKVIEINLFNIGDATITIFNQLGQVVASDFTLTNLPSTINLNITTGSGSYYIVITSAQTSAQGWFVL